MVFLRAAAPASAGKQAGEFKRGGDYPKEQ